MSKASIRASIDTKKAQIATLRTEIATWRSRKSTTKEKSYKVYCDESIRRVQSRIASIQREIVSLRERMKYEK